MITKPSSITELQRLFTELFLAGTTKVSKVSQNSVLSAVSYGVGKAAQMITKDIAILEGNILPDSATGTQLDSIAYLYNTPARFASSGSTVWLRLIATAGTVYTAGTHNFISDTGETFQLEATTTIGSIGYAFAKARSVNTGASTNVEALKINKTTPSAPSGHLAIYNDYAAFGGQDAETDDLFRARIKNGINVLATDTLAKYEQIFMKINNNVLKVLKGGTNDSGQLILYIATVNGSNLNSGELAQITNQANDFLSLTEQTYGIELRNITWTPIDISLRVSYDTSVDADSLRINLQTSMQKILDWRYWNYDSQVVWADLLVVAKRTYGILQVPSQWFQVAVDNVQTTTSTMLNPFALPRVRSFSLMDLNGTIISDTSGILNPTYFPNQMDLTYQLTYLQSI